MKARTQDPADELQSLEGLILGARDDAPVAGLTHNFYRYPARFSPTFVRSAILAFSEPGDWVMDPFAGGGTTLVEALAHGRSAIGTDISSLATFICEAKTLVLSDHDVALLNSWIDRLPDTINIHGNGQRATSYADAGYYRNLEGAEYWRLRKALEQVLASIVRIRSDKAQILARCILLKTSQWALDARKILPSITRFRTEIVVQAQAMLAASVEFRTRLEEGRFKQRPVAICANRSAADLPNEAAILKVAPPKLIVTSPPYPGIHILYHRWQVDGRKEAPAPFWIANRLDGAGSSYYTMGDRKNPELRTYFANLEASFQSIANIAGPQTTIVQMVAFSDPDWQLPRYLEVMQACGLRELFPLEFDVLGENGRLWRTVPRRRWHARQNSRSPGAREVVLIHRKNCN
jgi:hypothetical protein